MSRIALVGGSSALAQCLLPRLREGSEVTTLGRKGCDLPCDLLDTSTPIPLPESTGTVVHLAAAFGGPAAEDHVRALETNAVGTLRVCLAARDAGVAHVVLISSIYAGLPNGSPFAGIYSLTKRQAEELAQECCERSGIRLTILRPSPLYGDQESFRRHQPLLYAIADHAEKGEDILLFGTRDPLRNFLHAEDLARVISRVVESRCGGIHPCTFPQDAPLTEIAGAALEAFGRGGQIRFLREKPDIPDRVFGNSTELYDQIGVLPELDIREGMRRLARHRGVSRS